MCLIITLTSIVTLCSQFIKHDESDKLISHVIIDYVMFLET